MFIYWSRNDQWLIILEYIIIIIEMDSNVDQSKIWIQNYIHEDKDLA